MAKLRANKIRWLLTAEQLFLKVSQLCARVINRVILTMPFPYHRNCVRVSYSLA